jgi:hypothetical protein
MRFNNKISVCYMLTLVTSYKLELNNSGFLSPARQHNTLRQYCRIANLVSQQQNQAGVKGLRLFWAQSGMCVKQLLVKAVGIAPLGLK